MVVLFIIYWLAAFGLFVYGLNTYLLVRGFRRGRREHLARLQRIREEYWAAADPGDLPVVTVQLPLFNERFVAGRLIHAMTRLDWPRDRLEIQVLDDSNDETVGLVAELVRHFRRQGFRIEQVRRKNREGYKAGALRDGLQTARGELIAIFDADFVPEPDFLRRTVPFFRDPAVGLVQARWGHVNADYSVLTQAQAIAIDGHFSIEQAGRAWSGWYLNFNGTAGIWRRATIEDAGGWRADTLTEDLDLSYRAQLAGWRIEYAMDVEVPAEVPVDISAFKSQQHRWAKGSIQTAKKLMGRVLRRKASLVKKFEAVLHLTHYAVHPLMLTIALLALPLLAFWEGRVAPLPFAAMVVLLGLSAAGPSTLYLCSQRALYPDWKGRLKWLPVLMVVGTGIAVSNTRAVLEALLGIKSGFVRTPKRAIAGKGAGRASIGYRLPIGPLFLVEAFLSLYSLAGLVLYVLRGKYLIGPFLFLYAAGFGTMAIATLREVARRRRAAREAAEAEALDPVLEAEAAYGEVIRRSHDAGHVPEPALPRAG